MISVYNKQNLDKLVPYLERNNYQIYSTGGTMTKILEYVKDKSIVHSISDYTDSPEICDGRVKTLHPRIYGGILCLRNKQEHINDLATIKAELFYLIVVNLYPFEKVLEKQSSEEEKSEEELLENIDIGGHTLLRAASKNYKHINYDFNDQKSIYFLNDKNLEKSINLIVNNDISKINNNINWSDKDLLKDSLFSYLVRQDNFLETQ